MKFTDIFIKRPVLATVVSLLILLLGLKSFFNLDLRQYPKIETAVITVTTVYPGASAQLMQGFVTQPLQTAISSADGIDYLTSTSSQGISTITAKLRMNFDSSIAFTDIMAKVNSVSNQLPQGAQSPVIVKGTGRSIGLLIANYSSEKMNTSQIYDYILRVVQPKLQSVPGVSSADVFGSNPFAMRIWLKPDKMAALKVTADDINAALISNSYLSAAGQLKGLYTIINLNAHTDLHTVDEFKQLVVRQNKGKLIRMRDVAEVELGSESYSSSVTYNGQKGVFVSINALPNANPLTVIKDIRIALPEIEKALPPSLKQALVYDSTKFISSSINDVIKTLLEAAVIVIMVIFLFLGSLRSVLIPMVTIPLSLVGVCFIMFALGYSINLMTLLAMVLAIGLVVDDAIVVLENIHRHIEQGKSPLDAALIGAREIAVPVITMTVTLAAVYAPIGLMGGLTGALFKEFAFTLAASVFVSGIVALTLSPMMCSKILVHTPKDEKNFANWIDVQFSKVQQKYELYLGKVLNQKKVVVVFGSVIFISVFFLFILTPKELAPQEDQGFLFSVTNAPPYANVHYLEKFTNQINSVFSKYPEHDGHFIINGAGNENSGFAGIIFKPWDERKKTPKEIQPLLQEDLNQIAGIKAFIFPMPDLPTGSDGMPVQFVLRSTVDYKTLYKYANELQERAKKSGLFIVTLSDLAFETPQLEISIDKSKAAQMNISMQQIGNTLSTMLGGNYINRFSIDGRSYKVITELPDKARYNPSDLEKVYIRTSAGTLVPLSNFVSFQMTSQPGSLNQFQQLNSAKIQAVMMPNQTAATGLDFLEKTAKEILPKNISYDFAGDSRALKQEGNTLVYTFGFALIAIFLVLAAQFESFRDPLVIMISVPMAICGALIPLNLGFATINIYTQIGLVTLIGLITKHGILMVEFANKLREEQGVDKLAAIEKAASVRLRPILMTTAAMVVGVVPLVIASGAGAASRHDIGLVIAMGLTIGTLFTLFVIPTMYTIISGERKINSTTP
jgi:hydrophobe/amphiphile efflux-1 (HAE1) family protein